MNKSFLTALPVYNEGQHVLSVLREVEKYSPEILVVDDGSQDETAELLAQFPRIHVCRHAHNQGYGAALRTAFQYSLQQGFEVLVTIDCDGQHQPAMIPGFVSYAQQVDIVSGSRYLTPSVQKQRAPEQRRLINSEITDILNRELQLKLTDAFCGFKAYRKEALDGFDITEQGYGMPLQLWIQAARAHLEIQEVPVPLIYLDASRSFGGALDSATDRLNYYKQVIQKELHPRCI